MRLTSALVKFSTMKLPLIRNRKPKASIRLQYFQDATRHNKFSFYFTILGVVS